MGFRLYITAPTDRLNDVSTRAGVTEGYATKKWDGEPIAPGLPRPRDPRAQLGHGPLRPSIFQSSNEGIRRVVTTPAITSNYTGVPRFADFGGPPARPLPAVGGVRARVASLGNYPSSVPAISESESGTISHHSSNSDSESDLDGARSATAGSDPLAELFESGEERAPSVGSSMFGSRPAAAPTPAPASTQAALGVSPRQPRVFQQTQSLPAGSLSFGIGTGQGVATLESLGEEEPWRQLEFSKYATMPPE